MVRKGEHASLALDVSGKVHISYRGGGSSTYTTNASASWITEVVDKSEGNTSTSIAVDAKGKVHISYSTRSTAREVKYTTNLASARENFSLAFVFWIFSLFQSALIFYTGLPFKLVIIVDRYIHFINQPQIKISSRVTKNLILAGKIISTSGKIIPG
jgi:hypothetical protein